MTGHDNVCRRGCCWTPHAVCARAGNCDCHRRGRGQAQVRAAETAGISIDELFRRERLKTLKAPKPEPKRYKTEDGKWTRKRPSN